MIDRELNSKRKKYFSVFAILLILSIFVQIRTQVHLNDKKKNLHILNIAGRQRMLLEKITKYVYSNEVTKSLLNETMNKYRESHEYLKKQNYHNLQINKELAEIELGINEYFTNIYCIIDRCPLYEEAVTQIFNQSEKTVIKMNLIVKLMESSSESEVQDLSDLQWILICLIIIGLLFQLLFVFRPILREFMSKLLEMVSRAY